MDKIQASNEKRLLDHEKEAFKQLKKSYTNALADIKTRVKILQSSINDLEGMDVIGYDEKQKEIWKSQIQSKVYQLEYQKTLEKQVGAIVNVLKEDTISNVQGYLNTMYKDSYLGIQYYINQRGIPIVTPINPSEVVKVVNKPIEEMTFANRINANMNDFKKTVKAEISRGLANGSTYKEIASNLSMVTGEDMYKSQRIIRTEGARVSTEAKLTSIRDMKEKGADLVKVWDSTLDGKTRWEHMMLDGQIAEVDEPFKVAGYEVMGPAMFGDPSQDCNCRCVLLSVPRWDVDDTVVKYDNEREELVETKNYNDWKQGYYRTLAEEETKSESSIKKTGNAKTVAEALKDMAKYSNSVSLSGIKNLKNLNEVNRTLDDLTTKYPTNKLKEIKLTRSRRAMASANFESLNLKKSYFDKESFEAVANIRKQNEEQYKLIVDKLERLKSNKELDEYVLREYRRQLEQAKRMLENSFKYKRFNVVYDDIPIQSVITHEYGHIIADQYIGQINKRKANLNFDYNTNNELYQLNNKIDRAYRKAIETGDIYEISEYASSKSSEFFAEAFTIYDIGKEKLPDYIVEVIEEVINYGKK